MLVRILRSYINLIDSFKFIICMLTFIAVSLFRTLESIATPCSVNANGNFLRPPYLDVTDCDFKILTSSYVN